jgi:predicted RNase H-like HicB family nuclease
MKFNLTVVIMKEGDKFVAYTPALDLSTYGNTLKEAQDNFSEAVTIFFEELKEMGTTDEVLNSLGWTKQKKELMPPEIVSHHTESFSVPLAC